MIVYSQALKTWDKYPVAVPSPHLFHAEKKVCRQSSIASFDSTPGTLRSDATDAGLSVENLNSNSTDNAVLCSAEQRQTSNVLSGGLCSSQDKNGNDDAVSVTSNPLNAAELSDESLPVCKVPVSDHRILTSSPIHSRPAKRRKSSCGLPVAVSQEGSDDLFIKKSLLSKKKSTTDFIAFEKPPDIQQRNKLCNIKKADNFPKTEGKNVLCTDASDSSIASFPVNENLICTAATEQALQDEPPVKSRQAGVFTTTYIPTELKPDGSYAWTLIRVRKTQTTEAFDAENDKRNDHSSLVASGCVDGSISERRRLFRGARWAYVEDSLYDVAGFDEELKLPSVLARNVRYLQRSFLKSDPPTACVRYNEDYALRREASLTSRKAYFFLSDIQGNSEKVRNFNIYRDVEDANTPQLPSAITSSLICSTPGAAHAIESVSQIFYLTATPGLIRTDEHFYRLWGEEVKEGGIVRVLFLDCAVDDHCVEEEEFQLFRLDTLNDAFIKACDLSFIRPEKKPKELTSVHLARYAPTLFWNLVFQLESDPFQIRQFLSRFTGSRLYGPTLRVRRASLVDSPKKRRHSAPAASFRIATTASPIKRRSRASKASSALPENQNNFFLTDTRGRAVFDAVKERAAQRVALYNKKPRRLLVKTLHSTCAQDPEHNDSAVNSSLPSSKKNLRRRHHALKLADVRVFRRERRAVVSDEPQLLVETYLDADGFPKQSLAPMSLHRRRVLYGYCCLNGWTAPLEIRLNEKGRAVYAAHSIDKEDFVCEYAGEFIQLPGIAKLREAQYEAQGLGSYMFYFKDPFSGRMSCIDATAEHVGYGPARFINHSHLRPNCYATVVRSPVADGRRSKVEPRLIFLAKRFIEANEELLIDYGETNPKVLEANPWLLNT